jgi:cell division protein FtsB
MSSSDARMFEALAERVQQVETVWGEIRAGNASLAARLTALEAEVARLRKGVEGEDVSGALYGAEPDHAVDREARAALLAKRRDR